MKIKTQDLIGPALRWAVAQVRSGVTFIGAQGWHWKRCRLMLRGIGGCAAGQTFRSNRIVGRDGKFATGAVDGGTPCLPTSWTQPSTQQGE